MGVGDPIGYTFGPADRYTSAPATNNGVNWVNANGNPYLSVRNPTDENQIFTVMVRSGPNTGQQYGLEVPPGNSFVPFAPEGVDPTTFYGSSFDVTFPDGEVDRRDTFSRQIELWMPSGDPIFIDFAGYCDAPAADVDLVFSAVELANEMIGTFHEREGTVYNYGSWNAFGRVFGRTLDLSGSDLDLFGGQIGVGHFVQEDLQIGAFLGYGETSQDWQASSVDTDGFSVGLYGTYFIGDAYIDIVGMYTDLSYDVNSFGWRGDVDGDSWAASAEVGVPFEVAENFVVEPQGQLIYTNVDHDDFSFGVPTDAVRSIALEDGNNLRGRLGVRLSTDVDVDGQALNLFGEFNYIRQLDGDSTYRVTDTLGGEFPATDSTTSTNSYPDNMFEVGGGFSYAVAENTALFTNVEYVWGDNNTDGVEGTVGVRIGF